VQFLNKNFGQRVIPIVLLVLSSQLVFIEQSRAATATATGAHPTPARCDQTVSDATNVEVERLVGGDCVITFKSGSIDWTTPQGLTSIQILLVGGGGGGGAAKDNGAAGGGGGGQVKEESSLSIAAQSTYSISVGTGGALGNIVYPNESDAGAGGNSSLSSSSSTLITALGGNPGGGSRIVTSGAANSIGDFGGIGGTAATSSVASQGGSRGGGGKNGGGGGGSSGDGQTPTSLGGGGGAGGAGTTSTILDSNNLTTTTFGTGGAGGKFGTTLNGTSGTTNRGIGGKGAGAGSGQGATGGSGGSGVVIIRFSPVFVPGAPTLNSVSGGDKSLVISFTAGSAGSPAVTDYEYSLNGGSYISAGTTSSPFTISGLSGRTAYSVAIKARNSVGLGTASSSLSATTTDSTLDASEAAAEAARVASAARLAREQKELTEIMAMIPKIGELTLSLGEVTRSLTSTKCVKGKTTKFVNKGAKCPKGFVKKKII